MSTSRSRTPWAIAAVVAVSAVAMVVVAGLAGAGEPAGTGPVEPAPAVLTGRTEPGSVPPTAPTAAGDPNSSVSSPVLPFDPNYWTPERMASAQPAPMPTPG